MEKKNLIEKKEEEGFKLQPKSPKFGARTVAFPDDLLKCWPLTID